MSEKKSKAAKSDKARKGEMIAALAAAVIGLPLVIVLGSALIDGQTRLAEGPLKSLLGENRYDELVEGRGGFPHYMGHERLAPDFTVHDRNGRPWRLADQRGKVVLLNFWSITCPPCLEEMPALETLSELAERWDDVEIVAVSTDEGWDAVSTVLPTNPKLTHLFDPDKSVTQGMFGTELYPETWIIDGRGVVRLRFDGQFDWSSPLVLDVIEGFR